MSDEIQQVESAGQEFIGVYADIFKFTHSFMAEMREFKDSLPQKKAKIGTKIRDILVSDLEELEDFCKNNSIDTAILCVPKEAAPGIADRLYSLGIRNYWNFSHYDLSVQYQDIIVENVHLNDSLMIFIF